MANKDAERVKKPLTCNLAIKVARIVAGYDSPRQFVDAVNLFLEGKKINYRIAMGEYMRFEKGNLKKIQFNFAYYISSFLDLPIDTFVEQKVCQ
jgi:hypothetical protein